MVLTSQLQPCWVCTLGAGRAQQRNNGYCQHFCPVESLTSGPYSNNSVFPCKSLMTPEQLAWRWCSERAGLSLWKSCWNTAPFRGVCSFRLSLPQPLSHSAAGDWAALCLCPLVPPTVTAWFLISRPSCKASVPLDHQAKFLAVCSVFLSQLWCGHKRGWAKLLLSMPFCLLFLNWSF